MPLTGNLLEMTSTQTSKYPHGEGSGYDLEIEFVAPGAWPQLTGGLLKRGYRENEIRGILGENWLRVTREVWG